MAPFLFLLVVEGMTSLVRQTTKQNLLREVKIGKLEIEINFLQFTNYTVFICEPNYESIFTLKYILRCFKVALGLRINFHKSMIGAIGVVEGLVDTFSHLLNNAFTFHVI